MLDRAVVGVARATAGRDCGHPCARRGADSTSSSRRPSPAATPAVCRPIAPAAFEQHRVGCKCGIQRGKPFSAAAGQQAQDGGREFLSLPLERSVVIAKPAAVAASARKPSARTRPLSITMRFAAKAGGRFASATTWAASAGAKRRDSSRRRLVYFQLPRRSLRETELAGSAPGRPTDAPPNHAGAAASGRTPRGSAAQPGEGAGLRSCDAAPPAGPSRSPAVRARAPAILSPVRRMRPSDSTCTKSGSM